MPTKRSARIASGTPDLIHAKAREVVRSPDFTSIYTNDIQIQTSPWDIRLLLGEISNMPTTEAPTMAINLLGELRMSPQIAKVLAVLLMQQISTYEANFGPIPGPSN